MARNRNMYSRSKEARDAINGMRGKYKWLGNGSPVMQLMSRKFVHPREAEFAINESYDGEIPDNIDAFGDFLTNQESPYNAFVNDMWSMLMNYGPSTLEDVSAVLPADLLSDPDSMSDYITNLMAGAKHDDNEDSDMILSSYKGPMEYDEQFLAYEDDLQDLFDDARAYANASGAIKAAEDSKESWLDRLYDKRNPIDSNGDPKGKDGLAGTKDDRGTGSAEDEYDDEYDDVDDSDDDETDDVLSDATQKNILSALLGHSL